MGNVLLFLKCIDLYGGPGSGVGGAGVRDTNKGMTICECLKHLGALVVRFLEMYKARQEVDYWAAIRDVGLMDILEGVEDAMQGDGVGMPMIQGLEFKKAKTKKK